MNNLIQQLKDNEKAFGLMSPEMQAAAKDISRVDFQCYMRHGVWLKCHIEPGEEDTWTNGITYRLRAKYADEPDLVECEIYSLGTLFYRDIGGIQRSLSKAIECPDFIGFKFKDGTVMGSPVKYSVPGITSHGYYASYEDLKTGQALEHHACHVLFRRKKQE